MIVTMTRFLTRKACKAFVALKVLMVLALLLSLPPSLRKAGAVGEMMLVTPGYFAVTGVASGDHLNVRAAPDADSAIVGALPPNARPVEVMALYERGASRWGKIMSGERPGWVSMRYLEPIDLPRFEGTALPLGLNCAGTEPFWGLRLTTVENIGFETPEPTDALTMTRMAAGTVAGRSHMFYMIAGKDQTRMSAFITSGSLCSDGMSDRDYPWRIHLLLEKHGSAPIAHEGCCARPLDR